MAGAPQSDSGRGLLPGSHRVTTQVSSAQVLSLHNSSAEIKNPYCANSIRGKKEREMGGEVRGGWVEEDADRKEGASWLRSPACLLCVRKQLWPTEDYITY